MKIGNDTELKECMRSLKYVSYSNDKELYNKLRKLHLIIGDRVSRDAVVDDSVLDTEKLFTLDELRELV